MGLPWKTLQVRITSCPIVTGLGFAVSLTLGDAENYKCKKLFKQCP